MMFRTNLQWRGNLRNKEKIFTSPEDRAKELLANLLTKKQAKDLQKCKIIVERGAYGVYWIFLLDTNAIRVEFVPYRGRGIEVISKARMICVSNMIKSGPWPDVAATLLLYIRAGQELMIFEKGTILKEVQERRLMSWR